MLAIIVNESRAAVHYQVSVNPNAHQFTVTFATVAEGQRLSLPAWIPGSYLVRDFSKSIVKFAVTDPQGARVDVAQLDKHTWQLPASGEQVTVMVVVYANDTSVRAAYLDHTGGFFNGTSVFLMDESQRDQPHSVSLDLSHNHDWQLAVALPEAGGRYQADNYDALVDSPFMFGALTRIRFAVKDVPHELVLLGATAVDEARAASDLQAICAAHVDRMGELPCPQYLFLTNVVGAGYGGLEHKDSTLLEVARRSLPYGPTGDDYTEFLGLCSHEYFHLWNVKRIRPAGLVPLDYSTENYTKLLWLFEGVTSYLDDYTMLGAGVIAREQYLALLATMVSRVINAPGNTQRSLEDSSFYTWTQFYQQNENAPNAVTNYYSRGALVALCLDLLLRDASAGAVNMDVLMRTMWQVYGATDTPVPEGDGDDDNGLLQMCLQLLPQQETRLREYFQRYVCSNELPDVAAFLQPFGVQVQMDAASEKFGKQLVPTKTGVAIGARYAPSANGVRLKVVMNGGAAEAAGLMPGDQLVAINGLKASGESLEWSLAAAQVGDALSLHVFRGDELLTMTLTLSAPWMHSIRLNAESLTPAGDVWLGDA